MLTSQAPSSDVGLEIGGVEKRFGAVGALRGISLQARDREFLAVLGPSGSGKTTLLRILAGLEQPDSGTITLAGQSLLGQPPQARRIGMVFQNYALFPHMTLASNIAFGLEVRPRDQRPEASQVRERVLSLLDLVQLPGMADRYPAQLSGGQRQRVALARALAIDPRMLLLDEPFGALDGAVRRELRQWLRALHDQAGVTTLFVTHDPEEAMALADRVAIIVDGALAQLGTPTEVYDSPVSAQVYDLMGPSCRLEGTISEGLLRIGDGEVVAPKGAKDGPTAIYFRPDDALLGGNGPTLTVDNAVLLGAKVKLALTGEGGRLELVARSKDLPTLPQPGDRVRITPERFELYPR